MDPYFIESPDYSNDIQINNQTVLPTHDPFPNLTNDSTNGFKINDQCSLPNSNQYSNVEHDFKIKPPSQNLNFMEIPLIVNDINPNNFSPSLSSGLDTSPFGLFTKLSPGGESSSDDSDFSETVLKYISQILMEENIEEKPCMFYDPLGLQNTEKSFYDVIGKDYPPSSDQSDYDFSGITGDVTGGSSSTISTSNTIDPVDYKIPTPESHFPGDYKFVSNMQVSSQFTAQNRNSGSLASSGDAMVNELIARNIFSNSETVLQFRKGLEEANKFLPGSNNLTIDLENGGFKGETLQGIEMIEKVKKENSPNPFMSGRKNHERDDVAMDSEEARSNKQSAVYDDESELSEMFDRVLLYNGGKDQRSCYDQNETLQNEGCGKLKPIGDSKESSGGKGHAKNQGKKEEIVDLRNLLILCAQAVSTNDFRTANELLKQIRQHSSPFGDGSQRFAHFFANGLEARMTGTGNGCKLFFASLASKKISAADMLKAYQVHLSACPFKKMGIFFANKMILKVAEKAKALHIVDFGILYGFQWPILIQHLSYLPDGPPKLRITGIEFPQPGFRPAERIEETGRRLKKYCDRFNVPFEYHAIASQNWETILIEDFKLDSNEVLAVNCLYRFKNLLDETVEVNSPRNAVLELIRKMNPNIFVQTIVNGSYNAPFFITRFREALFHYSAMFDMFDINISRENEERLMFEREFSGREVMNVIACEGLDRVERPETYKQWQIRCMRAGFKQLPLDQELMEKFRSKMKNCYHKDFVLDQDNHWILQGWKGRIIYASSCWVPA